MTWEKNIIFFKKISTLGPCGPLLHRGVLVVLQSEQTLIGWLILLIMVFEDVVMLLVLSVSI